MLTVKTAYMIRKGGNLDDYHEAWVELCRVDVSPKAQNFFLWRVSPALLLFVMSLKSATSLKMPNAYGVPTETLYHALMGCE